MIIRQRLLMAALFGASLFGTSVTFAHGGDDHDGPAAVQAPKGGMIKALEEAFVEVVNTKEDLKIYIYDKDMKPAKVALYKVSAQSEVPRTKKKQPLTLQDQGNHFEAHFDSKGLHRYTLVLKLTQPTAPHEDTLNFTIEPRK